MARKRTRRKRARSRQKDVFEKRVEDFSEEMEAIGKRMEKRGEEWKHGYRSALGPVAPLISSFIGLIFLVLFIWAFNFLFAITGISMFMNLGIFLSTNLALLFLLSVFFSFASYFSHAYRRSFLLISPVVTAAGVVAGFWVAMEILLAINLSLGLSVLATVAFYALASLPFLFWVILILGYLVVLLKLSLERAEKMLPVKSSRTSRASKSRPVAHDSIKRLYRSAENRILGGVCGGIAEYLNVDPVIIRILWVVGTFAWGAGILIYIILWIIIPRNPNQNWKCC